MKIEDVPAALQEEIFQKLHRERMAALGSRTSARKRASSRRNLAPILAAGKAETERRRKALLLALDQGSALTAAAKSAGINYSRAKAWLQKSGRL